MTMEVLAVTKALFWLETPVFTNVCILNDSMSMLRKLAEGVENGWSL
jgi:ribonuclease HI